MDFPVADLLDDELSEQWLLKHFHLQGLKCPHCEARRSQSRPFRRTRRSQVTVYRCRECQGLYNVYSGTIFQARHLRPSQVVLLLRGVCKGEPTATLAREFESAALDRACPTAATPTKRPSHAARYVATGWHDRDRRDVSACGGKKAKNTPTRPTRRAGGLTSGGGMGLIRTTARRWSAQSGAAAVKSDCA